MKKPTITDMDIPSADPADVLQCYKGFVWKIANRYRNLIELIGSVSMEDLEQAARIGLLSAQKTYDPTCGTKFTSWAAHYMNTEVKRAAGFTGSGLECAPDIPVYLDTPLSADDPEGDTMLDTIQDDAETMEDRVEREDRANAVHEAVNKLSDTQRKVVSMYYFDGKPSDEIGSEIGKSVHNVCAIKNRAEAELRHDPKLRSRILPSFYDVHIGIKEFNQTWDSPVEIGILLREKEYNREYGNDTYLNKREGTI